MTVSGKFLRLVSWNCCGGFAAKAARLAELQPDIAIVPEVISGDRAALGSDYQVHWFGEDGKKGVLVAARSPWAMSELCNSEVRHTSALSARLGDRSITVVPIWSKPFNGNYVEAVCRGLTDVGEHLSPDDAVIVAGDFNASVTFDAGRGPAWHFDRITKSLDGLGLKSVWHARTGEEFGAESQGTYFHYRHADKPFHIDYVFGTKWVHDRVAGLEIGRFEDWCLQHSDHVPLILDLEP